MNDRQLPDKTTEETRRIRVLWVIKTLNPGGAEQLLVNAAKVHNAEEFEIDCAFLQAGETNLIAELESAGIRCVSISMKPCKYLWPFNLARMIRKGDYDVIHSHSPLLASIVRIARMTMRPSRRPAGVTTEHSNWLLYHPATRILNRFTIGAEAKVFVVSQNALESMSLAGRGHAEVLIYGIHVSDVQDVWSQRSAVRTEFELQSREIVI